MLIAVLSAEYVPILALFNVRQIEEHSACVRNVVCQCPGEI